MSSHAVGGAAIGSSGHAVFDQDGNRYGMEGEYTGSQLVIGLDDISDIHKSANYANKLRNQLAIDRFKLLDSRHRPLLNKLSDNHIRK